MNIMLIVGILQGFARSKLGKYIILQVVNEFMKNLGERLKEERKLADTTVTQYLQTLFKLNNSKPFKNLAWTKKFEDVQKIIDSYAKSTQGNQYMVLTSALSLFNDKTAYKRPYNYWRDKMMEARKERDSMPENTKTEKQEENWLTWEEVSKKKITIERGNFVLIFD
jgi:hypothetical protein